MSESVCPDCGSGQRWPRPRVLNDDATTYVYCPNDFHSDEVDEPEPGEWTEPVHDNYLMVCCDCGLAHRFDFAVRDGEQVQMRAFRDEKATSLERRNRNIEVTHDDPAAAVPVGDGEVVVRLTRDEARGMVMDCEGGDVHRKGLWEAWDSGWSKLRAALNGEGEE